ncbi:MAG: hypothetical protein H6825_05580 [Planctomycetes bacterium]|nr:hypothetical protein [Planctomycetota bacterium]
MEEVRVIEDPLGQPPARMRLSLRLASVSAPLGLVAGSVLLLVNLPKVRAMADA